MGTYPLLTNQKKKAFTFINYYLLIVFWKKATICVFAQMVAFCFWYINIHLLLLLVLYIDRNIWHMEISKTVRLCQQIHKFSFKCYIFPLKKVYGENAMKINLNILELIHEIIPEDVPLGFWQLEFLLRFIMDNPKSINNLQRNAYPYVAEEFNCNIWCIEKNISRLIPLIDTKKLSALTGFKINVETLTTARLIKILVVYLKLNRYKTI